MIDLTARLSRAFDAAVLWRLGLISYDAALGSASSLADPQAFWARSRVSDPVRVESRPLRKRPRRRTLPRLERNRRGGDHDLPAGVRRLELGGASRGPGDHWGASQLAGRAVIHPDPGAPLALLLHGYAVPAPWWEEYVMQALLRRGLSAARIELPFHLSRRVPGQAPGSGFFSSDPTRTAAVLRQSVEDAAAVVAWARSELGVGVGVLGTSLGGLVGALLAANLELEAAMLVTPACDLVEIILERAPERLRRRLDVVGDRGGPWGTDGATARAALEEALAPVLPRRLLPRTSPDRIVAVAADHDAIVGAEPVRHLARTWGVECWSYPRGHVTLLTARGLNARILARLADDLRMRPALAATG